MGQVENERVDLVAHGMAALLGELFFPPKHREPPSDAFLLELLGAVSRRVTHSEHLTDEEHQSAVAQAIDIFVDNWRARLRRGFVFYVAKR